MLLAAATEFAYTPPTMPTAPSMASMVMRLLVMTSLGTAICAAILWYARRHSNLATPTHNGPRRLLHVADLPLDRRGSLHLLKVGSRKIVVGSDPGGLKAMILIPESFERELEAAG